MSLDIVPLTLYQRQELRRCRTQVAKMTHEEAMRADAARAALSLSSRTRLRRAVRNGPTGQSPARTAAGSCQGGVGNQAPEGHVGRWAVTRRSALRPPYQGW